MHERSHGEAHAEGLESGTSEDECESVFKVVADRGLGLEEGVRDELAVEKGDKLIAESVVRVKRLYASDTLASEIPESGVVARGGAVADEASVVDVASRHRSAGTAVTRVDIGAVTASNSKIGHVEVEPPIDGCFVTSPWNGSTIDGTRLWSG